MSQAKKRTSSKPRSLDGNAFAILERDHRVKYLADSDSEILYTLITCVEDDSQSWEDFRLLWPRSTASDDAPADIDELEWKSMSLKQWEEAIGKRENWILLDLPRCCIFTGPRAPEMYVAGKAPYGASAATIELEIAPWWHLKCDVDPTAVRKSKRKDAVRVSPNRNVLWGTEWFDFLATELLKAAQQASEASKKLSYRDCVRIHKDWLMTPRASLDGKTPREKLHLAKEWISHLSTSQKVRLEEGLDPIPLPLQFSGYDDAPIGKNEIVIYFDATRELIEYGSNWIQKHIDQLLDESLLAGLKEALQKRYHRWIDEKDSDGLSPALVIQFERQRLPLVGMSVHHVEVCNCPICQFAASGGMGTEYIIYDGHQLELDEDFAFSLFATREEWEEENPFANEDEDEEDEFPLVDELGDELGGGSEGELKDSEEMVSSKSRPNGSRDELEERVWRTNTPEENELPGTNGQQLGFAFLFAEFTSEVDCLAKSRQQTQHEIEQMVRMLGVFRLAVELNNEKSAKQISQVIQQIMERFAAEFPQLVPRVADLTSRLDDEIRKIRS